MNKKNKVDLPEKRGLTVDEIISKYPGIIKIMLGELISKLDKLEINEDWLPTPENINALPEPVRKFIHDIETNTDPAHIVRENILIKDTCKALLLGLKEKQTVTEEFVEKWVKGLEQLYINCGNLFSRFLFNLPRQVIRMLKEAGVKVVKQ